MTTRTFTTTAGGSWETATNWGPSQVVPGENDTALISVPGTYTVTMGSLEEANSVTMSDPAATLSISASGEYAGNLITLNAGTLAFAGTILGATVVANGGAFAPTSGTLDGVTWQGPLGGSTSLGSPIVDIKDGITLLNLAGTGPGTLNITSLLYMANILDSTPLSDMTINFDTPNNGYLTDSSGALIVDTSMTIN